MSSTILINPISSINEIHMKVTPRIITEAEGLEIESLVYQDCPYLDNMIYDYVVFDIETSKYIYI
jgi:hypothetical protein